MGTTCLSLYMTSAGLRFQSKAFKENSLEYTMVCLKAKQGWIPFGNIIQKRQLFNDLDLGEIALKKTGIISSDVTGGYEVVNYKFSDQTLKNFTKLIKDSELNKRTHSLEN